MIRTIIGGVTAGLMLAAVPLASASAAEQTVREGDFIDALSDTRSTGHWEFDPDGLDVWTSDTANCGSSQNKAAEYWAPQSPELPVKAALDWAPTTNGIPPGGQLVFDVDDVTGNGNDYNILVFEQVYGDNVWLTNGSSADAKAADPSGADNGGNGSEWFGTLPEWKSALPATARLLAVGFSIGSGVCSSGEIESIVLDYADENDSYYFSSDSANPCYDSNYFPEEKMWEITWGRQFDDEGSLPTFDMSSNGGLTSVNGEPVPSYMTPDWHWLYVTEQQVADGRTVNYGFADGTTRKAVVFADARGCPAVSWTETGPPPVVTEDDVDGKHFASYPRSRQIRITMVSERRPENTTMGDRLKWAITVNGKVRYYGTQGYSDVDQWTSTRFGYAKRGANKVIRVYKNGVLDGTYQVNVRQR